MREIKFRAWLPHTKEMTCVQNLEFNRDGHPQGMIEVSFPMTEKSQMIADIYPDGSTGVILMQYTGLKDKQGKEIYEGDIVADHFYRNDGSDCGGIYIIKFGRYSDADIDYGSPGLGFYGEDKNGNQVSPVNFCEDNEIIGNVFENKELLNDNK